MKAFERIFLYSVLAVLLFYVFLVDSNVESKMAIQEGIRARSIVIVNDTGQEVVLLYATISGSGEMEIYNKDGKAVVGMGVNGYYNRVMNFSNKAGIGFVDIGADKEDSGDIFFNNKTGYLVALT